MIKVTNTRYHDVSIEATLDEISISINASGITEDWQVEQLEQYLSRINFVEWIEWCIVLNNDVVSFNGVYKHSSKTQILQNLLKMGFEI